MNEGPVSSEASSAKIVLHACHSREQSKQWWEEYRERERVAALTVPTLRDQFAMAVVARLTSEGASNPLSYFDAADRISNRAYLIADAMLERRKR